MQLLRALALALVVLGGTTVATSPCARAGCHDWTLATMDGTESDAVVVSPDSRTVYLAGSNFISALHARSGTPIWIAYPEAHWVEFSALAINPDGTLVYAAGLFGSPSQPSLRITALSTTDGSAVWRVTHPAQGFTTPVVTPDGQTLVIAGRHDNNTFAWAINAHTGQWLWTDYMGGPGLDEYRDLALSPDGYYAYAVGRSDAGGTRGEDIRITSYLTSGGYRAWTLLHHHSGADRGDAIAVSDDGERVFVAGHSDSGRTFAFATAAGAPLWNASLPAGAGIVDVLSRGSRVYTVASHSHFRTTAYDAATGAQEWVRTSARPGAIGEFPTAATFSSLGTALFVAGHVWPGPESPGVGVQAIRLSDGAQLWWSDHDVGAPGSDSLPRAIAAARDGYRIHLAGGRQFQGDWYSGWSFFAKDIERASVPRSFAAQPGPSPAMVTLAWQEPERDGGADITAYKIQRIPQFGLMPRTWEMNATTRFVVDTDVPMGVEVSYRIAALTRVGEGFPAGLCTKASPWPSGVDPCPITPG